METTDSLKNFTDDALEELFLNRLPEHKACFSQLLELIVHFAGKNQTDRAETCADLLEDALKKGTSGDELILLLEQRAGWRSDDSVYASSCLGTLAEIFRGNSMMQLFLDASGLANSVHPGEALRRLQVLRKLRPGTCCYEKTWGLGTVAEVDEFDRKFVIDFEGKRAHRLAFGYAAESVLPLPDDHFLALKLKDPEKFKHWAIENPAETVKAMIRQFGEMNIARLRAVMTGLVVPDKEWSSFWAAARETLANDPLAQIPSGRNDPIRILSEKKEFNGQWRHDFLALRDVDRILAEVESLYAECPPQTLAGDFKSAVADRLKFIVRGMRADRHAVLVQALLLADAAGIDPRDIFDISIYGDQALLLNALNAVPARMVRPFLAFLEKNSLPVTESILQSMPGMSSAALSEAILHCRQESNEKLLCEKMRRLVQEDGLSVELAAWIGRNLQFAGESDICRPEVFAQSAFSLLQKSLAAGRRKDAGQLLRQIFTDKDLIAKMLQAMDEHQRLDFSRRINSLAGLTAADKIEIAAIIIPLFPSLTGAFGAPEVPVAGPRLTSYRSYHERQAQLEKIINVEIPRNSQEIGVARSYGDLRENYEYKAAREMQGLLLRRKAELEQMLSEARGSDFAGFSHEVAGQGTSVTLRMPDGKMQVYHILGEYDSDEKMAIISCRSRLAIALNGHRAGDTVEIPGENAPVQCVIEAIRELPAEIREWINGGRAGQ